MILDYQLWLRGEMASSFSTVEVCPRGDLQSPTLHKLGETLRTDTEVAILHSIQY